MKVENLLSPRTGKPVANQFHIYRQPHERPTNIETFQSYDSTICTVDWNEMECKIYSNYNYSKTTTKYFNIFLAELFGDMDGTTIKLMIKKGDDFEMMIYRKQKKMKFMFLTTN